MSTITMPVLDNALPATASRFQGYPFVEHLLCLLPLAGLLFAVFLLPGGEHDAARWFAALKARFAGATAAMSWLSIYGNVPFYGTSGFRRDGAARKT